MSTGAEIAIGQIDLALKTVDEARTRSQYDDLSDLGPELAKVVTLCTATVNRSQIFLHRGNCVLEQGTRQPLAFGQRPTGAST